MAGDAHLRWALSAWLIVLGALLVLAGCQPAVPTGSQQPGTAVVVFLDLSASIPAADRRAFKQELETQIVPWLSPGDRLLIAPIHDKTLTEFRPFVEVTLPGRPQFNGWMDNVLKHKRQLKDVDDEIAKLKDRIGTEISHVFKTPNASPHTDIFSSLLIAQKVFDREPRRKVLVLMSDMIEDNPPYQFDRMTWTPGTIDKVLTDLDGQKLIPQLADVCVYVSGVSAKSAALAESIGRFWYAYFKRTGADLEPSRYAHVLLHWPPAGSCSSTSTARAR
jgi:hypothetical protein